MPSRTTSPCRDNFFIKICLAKNWKKNFWHLIKIITLDENILVSAMDINKLDEHLYFWLKKNGRTNKMNNYTFGIIVLDILFWTYNFGRNDRKAIIWLVIRTFFLSCT